MAVLKEKKAKAKEKGESKLQKKAEEALKEFVHQQGNSTLRLSQELETMTGLESRVTILGHYQRGGTPSAADRVLATRLGSACIDSIERGEYGVMIAVHGEGTKTVPLEDVVGRKKLVPLDHSWIRAARNVGTCLGD
jgi:6-phosphofructokinase 1